MLLKKTCIYLVNHEYFKMIGFKNKIKIFLQNNNAHEIIAFAWSKLCLQPKKMFASSNNIKINKNNFVFILNIEAKIMAHYRIIYL